MNWININIIVGPSSQPDRSKPPNSSTANLTKKPETNDKEKILKDAPLRLNSAGGNETVTAGMNIKNALMAQKETHRQVFDFLQDLNLTQYAAVLVENGFDDMETIIGR